MVPSLSPSPSLSPNHPSFIHSFISLFSLPSSHPTPLSHFYVPILPSFLWFILSSSFAMTTISASNSLISVTPHELTFNGMYSVYFLFYIYIYPSLSASIYQIVHVLFCSWIVTTISFVLRVMVIMLRNTMVVIQKLYLNITSSTRNIWGERIELFVMGLV